MKIKYQSDSSIMIFYLTEHTVYPDPYGSFLYYTKKGCKMFSSAGVEYSVGCSMD